MAKPASSKINGLGINYSDIGKSSQMGVRFDQTCSEAIVLEEDRTEIQNEKVKIAGTIRASERVFSLSIAFYHYFCLYSRQ